MRSEVALAKPWGVVKMNPYAPFLTDYSNYSAAGGAFEGFAKGLLSGVQARQQEKERDAKMAAMLAQQQRESDQTQIELRKQGLMKGSDGQLTDAPMSGMQQREQRLKEFSAGAKTDESGNLVYDPESLKSHMADLALQRMTNTQNYQQQRIGLQERRFGETQNQNAVKAGKDIEGDSMVKDMTNARNNLGRGRSLLNGSMPLTYNNINAVQQDIINSLSKGGQSTEGKVTREMQESYSGRLNNLMAKLGKYDDVRKADPGLVKQLNGLLEDIDSQYAGALTDRVSRLGGSYGQSTNPKVQATVKQKVDSYSPQGLMKTKGLVSPGLVPAGQEAAPDDTAAKLQRLQELRAKAASGR